MRIAVISDTHRNNHMLEKAFQKCKDADLVIHLGDNIEDAEEFKKIYKKKVINVAGNCDFLDKAPKEIVENIGGKTFLITHGHLYNVKYTLINLKYRAMEVNADVALFGHTHTPLILQEEGMWIINPGSVSLSRKGPNSLAFIDIDKNKINAIINKL